MQRFNRVIVAVDLGDGPSAPEEDRPDEHSRLALDRGAWLARATGAELRLVAVVYLMVNVEPPWRESARPGDRPVVKERLGRLEELAAPLREQGIETSVQLRFGQATEQLLAAVEQWDADLLVVGGTARRNALGLLGSTSAQLFRQAPCSVWIARKAADHDFSEALAAVSLDDRVHGVLRVAATFAGAVDARLHVLNAVADADPQRLETARKALGEWTEPYAEQIRLGTVEAIAGEPGKVILEQAARHGAEIVFIGPSRRSALLSYLRAGSTGSALARLQCSLVCARLGDQS